MPKIRNAEKMTLSRRSLLKGAAAGSAAFGEADKFVIDTVGKIAGSGVQIIVKDSQSDSNKAAEAAKSLIADDGIAIMLVAPRGLWGTFSDRTGIHLLPTRRRLVPLGETPPPREA